MFVLGLNTRTPEWMLVPGQGVRRKKKKFKPPIKQPEEDSDLKSRLPKGWSTYTAEDINRPKRKPRPRDASPEWRPPPEEYKNWYKMPSGASNMHGPYLAEIHQLSCEMRSIEESMMKPESSTSTDVKKTKKVTAVPKTKSTKKFNNPLKPQKKVPEAQHKFGAQVRKKKVR